MYHNIERSGFHRGQYVGYDGGGVWRIRKVGKRWMATKDGVSFTRTTLKEISEALETTAAYLLKVA